MTHPFEVYEAAKVFLMKQEGFLGYASKPMKDDVLTIGYGHTAFVKEGDIVTLVDAQALLMEDITQADNGVRRFVSLPLYYDGEHIALISLVFNIGWYAFSRSRARMALNDGDFEKFRFEVADPVEGFVKVTRGGDTIPGLLNRRRREMALFFGKT